MRLKTRVLIIIIASLAGLIIMGAFGLYSMRQSVMEERRSQISQLLDFANSQLKYFHELETSGKMTRAEAQALAIQSIAAQKQGDNYFFIRTLTDETFIYHPDAKRIGKADPGAKLSDGRTTLQAYRDELAVSKNDKGFIVTNVARPNSDNKELLPKLNGAIKFEPWGWMPGIGFFTDDIDSKFWKQSASFLLVAAVLLALVAGLVFQMRNVILKQLGGEPQDAAENMKRIANGDLGVEIMLAKDDNTSLMASLKTMQMKLINLTSSVKENATNLAGQVQDFDLMSKSYTVSKSEEDLAGLLRLVKKLGKTADILGKSISRFKL